MTYLEAVNAILVDDGVIRGDDDAISSFSDTQHVANIRWAKKAVVQELNALRSTHQWEGMLLNATITTVADTRTYSLSNFLRFDEEKPWLLKVTAAGDSDSTRVLEWPGGEPTLRREIRTYRETSGTPNWWYWDELNSTTDRRIGLYPVPDAVYYYRYWYLGEFKSWTAAEGDSLPFTNDWEAEMFVQACLERFKYLRLPLMERNRYYPRGLLRHPALMEAESNLMAMLNPRRQRTGYGRRYVG